MKNYSFQPQGVCTRQITFGIDDEGKLRNVRFVGGCPGNVLAIGKLVEGADPKNVASILKGNDCGGRGTSCADQLSIALTIAIEKANVA
ncbi:TIGR03905 family TSCPD domain-containing protein [uncultured Selenomonas sp.]|uniref:TIGR03905 family TSCPD domain-containing protein n=1 Tax=uncultured Selenomonas sp. TaxID=159275 RepID=UPI0028ED8626|nr:TIGR03905 family TSCPD domain-containing protein [uncultured Selenomonas sp.]